MDQTVAEEGQDTDGIDASRERFSTYPYDEMVQLVLVTILLYTYESLELPS